MDDIKMYMENLDEFINDENRIVTYKWLSINLKISSNYAKRLLHHYVLSQDQDQTKDELHVTYLVIGNTTTSGGIQEIQVFIVPRSELSSTESLLHSVSCVHVYSVSRSKLKDQSGALYAADYDCIKQNLLPATEYGGISCASATLRSDADVASLRKEGTYRPSTPQDNRSAPDPRLVKPSIKKEDANNTKATDKGGKTNQTTKAAAEKKSSKGSLLSMFATQKTVKKEVKENKVDGKPIEEKKSLGKKCVADSRKAGRLSGFFTKGGNPRGNEIKKEFSDDEVKGDHKEKSPVMVLDDSDDDEPIPVKKETSPVKKSPPKRKSPVKGKSSRAKSKPVTQPKRSRILQMESDSSEEEGSESEEACPSPQAAAPVVLDSESEEEPVPRQAVEASQQRGKKRKLVDKTFEDEEGFFVTKKEYVDVTDSEPEETEPPPSKKAVTKIVTPTKEPSPKSPKSPVKDNKASKAKKPAKKASKASPSKTKQVSIMSFFKKK